jgi:hypothetical protein
LQEIFAVGDAKGGKPHGKLRSAAASANVVIPALIGSLHKVLTWGASLQLQPGHINIHGGSRHGSTPASSPSASTRSHPGGDGYYTAFGGSSAASLFSRPNAASAPKGGKGGATYARAARSKPRSMRI